MTAKILSGFSAVMILVSGCMLDSTSNAPIGVFVAGLVLLAVAVFSNKEIFE